MDESFRKVLTAFSQNPIALIVKALGILNLNCLVKDTSDM